MESTIRGVLRFSSRGLTKSRIACRLCVSADADTSAHTGRPSISIWFLRFGDIVIPERKIVYDIRAAGAEVPRGCFLKDNSQLGCKRASAMDPYRQGRPSAP